MKSPADWTKVRYRRLDKVLNVRYRFGYHKLDRIEQDTRCHRLDNIGCGWNSFCFRGLEAVQQFENQPKKCRKHTFRWKKYPDFRGKSAIPSNHEIIVGQPLLS